MSRYASSLCTQQRGARVGVLEFLCFLTIRGCHSNSKPNPNNWSVIPLQMFNCPCRPYLSPSNNSLFSYWEDIQHLTHPENCCECPVVSCKWENDLRWQNLFFLIFIMHYQLKSKHSGEQYRHYRSSPTLKQNYLYHLTILFLENLFDPGQVFWNINIHVGCIWVVTVVIPVERHNTNCHPIAHQRTTRITLREGNILICLFMIQF